MSRSTDSGVKLVSLICRVPEDLRKRVRIEAANEDLSMQQVVTSALENYFSLPKGAAPRNRQKKR